jgi:hypothetical protein
MTRLTSLVVALAACSPAARAPEREAPGPPPLGARIDRAGRTLTANALHGLLPADAASAAKEDFNRAAPTDGAAFVGIFERGLAFYDGLDGTCGNQWLSDPAPGPRRYRALAALLADDRLWIDSRATTCAQLFAVELGIAGDCGGRTPLVDAVDVVRSRLVLGASAGLDDGVGRDDHPPSIDAFPFLVAP